MKIEAIDSVFLAVSDLDACAPYERLGLRPSPASAGRRTLVVGGPDQPFAVHFLGAERGPLSHPRSEALAAGRPLFAVGLRVADLDESVRQLEARGVHAERFRDVDAEAAWLPVNDRAGTNLVLVRHSTLGSRGEVAHSFPLLRLDHLAAVTPDLDDKARFWADVLGVPTAGEVVTPTLIIRQLRIGGAVMELLAAASPDSPIRQRPPGLLGMASWEVTDLDACVEAARATGLTASDPAAGPLPGTRISTVQGTGLAGVNMQLLRYDR